MNVTKTDPPTATPGVELREHGGPDTLRFGILPLASPGSHDVVVDAHAIAVTGFDLKYRRGLQADAQPPGRGLFPVPQQLGREAAGVVTWIGKDVTTLIPGDHVVAVTHPKDPHGIDMARGLGNLSTGIDIPGRQSLGSYARFLIRGEDMWLRVPATFDLEQAASTLWAFSTAHRVLMDRLQPRLNELVVILGSTGALGIAALQLAAMRGARPIAATRDKTKADQLKELGAFHVLLLDDLDSAVEDLRDISAGRGVEHIIDFAGNPHVLRRLSTQLRLGGTVCIGAGEERGEGLPFRTADIIRCELNLLGIRGARRIDMLTSLDLLVQGRVHIPIARRFPLSQAALAHTTMENGLPDVGRVLLIPER